MSEPQKKLNKKARAELAKKKDEAKKAEKEALKKAKEEKRTARAAIPLCNKIIGSILIAISLLALSGSAYLIYNKFFSAAPLAKLLPASQTIAYAEFDLASRQFQNLLTKLQKYPIYSQSSLLNWVDRSFNTNFETAIKPWIGRHLGLAVLTSGDSQNKLYPILFIETRDRKKTLDFLNTLSLANQKELVETKIKQKTIYEYRISQDFSLMFLDRYLVITNNKNVLAGLIDLEKSKTVAQNKSYNLVATNLSLNRFGFVYIDMPNFIAGVLQNPAYLPNFWEKINLLNPLFKIFPAMGLSLAASENGLMIQHYASLNKTALRDPELFKTDKKYLGQLLKSVPSGSESLLGGLNLTQQFKRLMQVANEVHPAAELIIEGALRAQLKNYLGSDVSLEDDIYPLFSGEYLVATSLNADQPKNYLAVLELSKEDSQERLLKIKNQFLNSAVFSQPRVVEITNEDGSKITQITSEDVKVSESPLPDHPDITFLNIPGLLPIYMSIQPSSVFFSTDQKFLASSLNLSNNASADLKNILSAGNFAEILANSGEISYLNFSEKVKHWPLLAPWLEPVKSIIAGSNLFDDGLSTLYQIGL